MTWWIRQARDTDLPEIRKCEERNFSERYSSFFWAFLVPAMVPRSLVLVSTESLGGVLLADNNYIVCFCVDESLRRQGYGKKLMLEFFNQSQSKFRELYLHVRVSNQAAQNFYRTLGFVNISEAPKFYKDPDEGALVMTYSFPE